MGYRIIINAALAGFLTLSASFSAYALVSNPQKDAYLTLAEVIYNKSIYLPFRIELLEKLAQSEGIKANILTQDIRRKKLADNKSDTSEDSSNISAQVNKLRDKNDAIVAYIFRDLTKSDNENIRNFSIQVLNKLDKKEALPVFNELVQSPVIKDRLIGINGLSRIKDKSSVPVLLNLIQNADTKEKKALTEALINFQDERIVQVCEKLIKTEKDPEIIINSAIVLINSGKTEYNKLIEKYVSSKSIDDLRIASVKLKFINKKPDLALIEQLSFTPDPAVKIGVLSLIDKYKEMKNEKDYNELFIKILKRYIFDESGLVSYSSLKILACYQDKNITKILEPLIYNKKLGSAVINIILKTDNKFLIPILEELSKADEDQIKFHAAERLSDYGKDATGILKYLSKNSDNLSIKLSSAITLSKMNKKNNRYLKEIIKTSSKEARNIALLYLIDSGDKSFSADDLKTIAESGTDEANKLAAAFLLLNYNDKSGIDTIRKFLSARKPVNAALDYINQNILLGFLEDSDEWVRINSAYNLAKLGNRKGVEVLKKLLIESNDPKIRASSALMLGKTGDSTDINILALAYKDRYTRVKANAAWAVIEILSNPKNLEAPKIQ